MSGQRAHSAFPEDGLRKRGHRWVLGGGELKGHAMGQDREYLGRAAAGT